MAFMVFTNHETRDTKHGFFWPWMRKHHATGNCRPAHCASRQVTVLQFAIVRHCSPLFTNKVLPLRQCQRTLRRSRSASGQAPFAVQAPSLSALLPLRRTQYEPMSRRGNVLFCFDARSSTRRARCLAEVRVSGSSLARYSANGERANLLHSGGGRKVPRPVSNMGAVPMESAEGHRTRACVHKIFQEAEAKRVVRPDGSGIRFPRSTSS